MGHKAVRDSKSIAERERGVPLQQRQLRARLGQPLCQQSLLRAVEHLRLPTRKKDVGSARGGG